MQGASSFNVHSPYFLFPVTAPSPPRQHTHPRHTLPLSSGGSSGISLLCYLYMQVRNADPCLGPDLFHFARIWVKLERLIGENDQAWQILQRPEGRTQFKWNWGLECSWRKMLGVNRAGCWGPAGARSRGVSTGDLLLFPMMWTNHPLFSLIPISFLSSFPAMVILG